MDSLLTRIDHVGIAVVVAALAVVGGAEALLAAWLAS